MLFWSSNRRLTIRWAVGLIGMVLLASMLALPAPPPSLPSASHSRLVGDRGPANDRTASTGADRPALREAIEAHLLEARRALAEGTQDQAERAFHRATLAERVAAIFAEDGAATHTSIEELALDLRYFALVLLSAKSSESERVLYERLRLSVANTECARILAPDNAVEMAALPDATRDEEWRSDKTSIHVKRSGDQLLDLNVEHASAAELFNAIAAAMQWRSASEPPSATERAFDLQGAGIDAQQLCRDLAGAMGYRVRFEEADAAPLKIYWIPGAAPFDAEEGRAVLLRTIDTTLALAGSALDEYDRDEAHWLRVRCLHGLQRVDEALLECAALITSRPRSPFVASALALTANCYAARGDDDRALAASERLIELRPDHELARAALLRSADLLFERGLISTARDRYERLMRHASVDLVTASAKLGRLACRFHTELESATAARLQGLSAELAELRGAARDPALRARYLELSAALFRRAGASPLALRESLAAWSETRQVGTPHESAACDAAELALRMRLPLIALCVIADAESTGALSARAQELRLSAWDQLGSEIGVLSTSTNAEAPNGAQLSERAHLFDELDRARRCANTGDVAHAQSVLAELERNTVDRNIAAAARRSNALETSLQRLSNRWSALESPR